jgi:molybdenum cofactor sulfurtransferase
VEKAANARHISVRTGCFCNPGVDELANDISPQEMIAYFESTSQGDYYDAIQFLGKLRGTVRISVGFVTNVNDIASVVEFARSYLNKTYKPG